MDAARWERIQDLFHKVVDVAPQERLGALQRECGDDPSLIPDVLRMLETDEQTVELLDQGLPALAGQLLAGSQMPLPKNIGPWEIQHLLGEGGMGAVFFGVRRDLEVSAAIKVLRDSWLSPARRARFVREQKTLANLDHPNIARLLDASTLEDGTPYIVMEYVEGLHLDEYCDVHHCRLEERLRLFRSVCEAVQFAHARAVIHRDLKPSNVLVGPNSTVKLLDFGVARQLDDSGRESDVTRTGLRLLTPAFAAPEQLRGEPAAVTADVYSLGVILYRLLTGRLPFDEWHRDSEIALNRDVVRPSLVEQRSESQLQSIGRTAWSELDVICLKAMHNDVRHRYSSVEALIRDIDRFVAGEPLEARPDSLAYRLRKFVRRHRVAVTAGAAALSAAAVLASVFTARLAAERNAAIVEAARTQRIQQFMRNLFEGGDRDAGPAHDLRVASVLEKGVLEARALDKDPAVQAELYQNLGDIYQKLGDLPRAEELLQSALERRRALAGSGSADVAETTARLGLLRADQAKLDEAERLGREALEMSRRLLPPGHPKLAAVTEAVGRILEEKGEYNRAIPLLEEAVRQRSSAPHSAADLAGTLYELANANFYAGRYNEAEALNRRVLRMNQEIFGDRHPRVAEALVNLGAIQQDLGNYAEAERFHRQALEITRSFYGEKHYRTAAGFTLLARALVFQKRYDEAVPLLQSAVTVQEQVFGAVHPKVASAINELGTVALQRGDTDGAKAFYRRMLAIYRSVYPGGHYLIGTATSNLGSAFMAAKENAQAELLFREAVKVFTKTLSPDHLNTAIARIKLGRTLLRQKRFSEAEVETAAGYDVLRKQMNPAVTWLNAARTDLIEIYRALRQADKQSAMQAELANASLKN